MNLNHEQRQQRNTCAVLKRNPHAEKFTRSCFNSFHSLARLQNHKIIDNRRRCSPHPANNLFSSLGSARAGTRERSIRRIIMAPPKVPSDEGKATRDAVVFKRGTLLITPACAWYQLHSLPRRQQYFSPTYFRDGSRVPRSIPSCAIE